MKLRTKLPLYTSITVLITIAAFAAYSIIDFRNKTVQSIEIYKQDEIEQIKNELKDVVNMAHLMIGQSFINSQIKSIEEKYGIHVADSTEAILKMIAINLLKITVENLRSVRYGDDGYIWINDINPPYKVIMHAIKPELEGSGHVFYIGKTNKNVYEAFAEICQSNGEGFLEYEFYKQGSKERLPKISFIKLYEPLGWVVGTGVYVDYIDKMVSRKTIELNKQVNRLVTGVVIIGLLAIIIASLFLFFMSSAITRDINLVQANLADLAKGKTINKIEIGRSDEIGEIQRSLNALIDGLHSYSSFALQIGKGYFSEDFKMLSPEDNLGLALIDMRRSLQKAKIEEEKRNQENIKRNWLTEGNALFSDILRKYNNNIEELSYQVISNLIRYLDANQGGMFVLNDNNPEDIYLELIAAFAYDRKKFIKRNVKLNEGLLGSCAMEKETIYLTKIPVDYIQITSGLGTHQPTNLVLIPLKTENKVYGVMEIAAFKIIEPYQIEFLEKLSENIASSIFTVKINQKTAKLFEEFKIQAEEKSALEIELNRYLEELKQLQERIRDMESGYK